MLLLSKPLKHQKTLLSSLTTPLCNSLHTHKTFNFNTPTHQTLHCLLEKCTSMIQLKPIHAQLITNGLTTEILTMGKLISFCAVYELGDLNYARYVFDRMPEPNKFMYNSLIRGYVNGDQPGKGVLLYKDMVSRGVLPNEFTFPSVFKACCATREMAYWVGVVVHSQSVKLGFGSHVCVQNSVVGVYVACGMVGCARRVFDGMFYKSLVSWNSMIGAYSRSGCWKEAFLLFEEMREVGLVPDEFTLVSLLAVCSLGRGLNLGRYLHVFMVTSGVEVDVILTNALLDMYAKCGCLESAGMVFGRMVNRNVVTWTSMVDAYAKHGLIEGARQIFDQMPVKNVVSWNLMISSYVQKGQCKAALDLFHQMCDTEVMFDETTIVSVLSACCHIGDLDLGNKTHTFMCSRNIMPSVTMYNSLIDMYAKCGALKIAEEIFYKMPKKNTVSWNVIIGAFALHGHGVEAIRLFDQMLASGFWPDEVTLTALLSACSHGGLVGKGQLYFNNMASLYGVSPEVEHYACMVDLLGRGGYLNEAIKLVGEMPVKPDVVVWGALLGACRTHGYVEAGKLVLKQILELEPFTSGLYVLLSNMYSEAQRWEDVRKIRKLMNDHGIVKNEAISYVEIDGCIHEFMVDDRRHEVSSAVYSRLNQLIDHLKWEGYSIPPERYLDEEEF